MDLLNQFDVQKGKESNHFHDILKSLSEVEVILIGMILKLESEEQQNNYTFEQILEKYNQTSLPFYSSRFERSFLEKAFQTLIEVGILMYVDSRDKMIRRCKLVLFSSLLSSIPLLCQHNLPEAVVRWISSLGI
jgi:hypothetical protein